MAEVIDFPERALRQGLSKMPTQKVVAFSCSCAEILMPSYVEFSRKFDPDEHRHRLFRHALNLSWDIALGSPFNVDDLAVLQDQGLNAIPSEDEFPEIEGAYAEDAGAAVVFCLRVAMSEDVQDAIWAARHVYDALDRFVVRKFNLPYSNERAIVEMPHIQGEFQRQLRVLSALASMPQSSQRASIEAIRLDSIAMANRSFDRQ